MNLSGLFDPVSSLWVLESLAHVLWQGALIAVVAAALGVALKARSAPSRCLVYCVALGLTLACLPLNLWRLHGSGSASAPSMSQTVYGVPGTDGAMEPHVPVLADPTAGPVAGMAPGPAPGEFSATGGRPLAATDSPGDRLSWQRHAGWLLAAYLLGALAMTVRLFAGLVGCQRLRSAAQVVDDARVLELVRRTTEEIGLRVAPVVAYCARVTCPVVVGVLKPAILLPAALLNELTPDQVESLLLHEMAHIKRYDHLVNLAQRIVEAALFFHPAVWWLSHKISVEREHCCDDLAIRWGSEPCDYAESLVRVSEVRYRAAGLTASSAATLAASGNRPTRLRGRVLRVLGMPLPGPSVGLTRVGVASLAVVALASAALLAAIPEGSEPEAVSEAGDASEEAAREDAVSSSKEKPAKISGKIVLEDGSPSTAAGWLHSDGSYKDGEHSTHGWSSTEERFTNSFHCVLHSGTVSLKFFPEDDFAPAVIGPFELEAGETLSDVRIVLTPGHAQTVVVVGEQNQPIAGASVVAHPLLNGSTNGPNLPQETDENGQVRLEHVAPDTRYALRVEAPGFQNLRTEPRRMPRGGEQPITLRMVPAQRATGIVRFPDGSPAPGTKLKQMAEVFPTGGSGHSPSPRLLTTTDSLGRFDLDALSDDSSYVMLVEAMDSNRAVVADIQAGTRDAQIVLPERHDLVVSIKGDLEELPKRNGKPYLTFYQRFNVQWDDQVVGTLLTNYATIEPSVEGGRAIFRGLAIDLRPDADSQQVEVMLGQDENTKQIVEIARDSDRATLVEFDLTQSDNPTTEKTAVGEIDVTNKDRPELHGERPATPEAEDDKREPIGDVLGKPLYRDEIRSGFSRVYMALMQDYRQAHAAEIAPTEAEIEFAAAYFDKEHEKRIEGEAAEMREQLQAIEQQLQNDGLPEEERGKLEVQRRSLQGRLNPPGRLFAQFMLDHWKLQRHLYDHFGGGRILFQQAGLEAFDATRNWLEAEEKLGKFKIADPELRKSFYEYWTTHNHGAFLMDDPERIRETFLEPPWSAPSAGSDTESSLPVSREPAPEPQSDRDVALAYARALAAGDFDALERFWVFQEEWDREFARKIAEKNARTPEMTVELVSLQPLSEESFLACFLTNARPNGEIAERRAPLPTTFYRKEGRWRCGPPGNLRVVLAMRGMGAEQFGRRTLTQRMIQARFSPEGLDLDSQVTYMKALAEAFAQLAGPPYNLSEYGEMAEQIQEQTEQQEAMLKGVESSEDLLRLALQESGTAMLPKVDDYVLCFYLEADKDDPNARELPFADGEAPFPVEPFPCLTEEAIHSATLVKNPDRDFPRIEVELTESGAKLFAEITRRSIGKRMAIVVDGKVVSAPAIRSAITAGKAVLEGGFTREEAEAIVESLNSYRKEAREFLENLDKEESKPNDKAADATKIEESIE